MIERSATWSKKTGQEPTRFRRIRAAQKPTLATKPQTVSRVSSTKGSHRNERSLKRPSNHKHESAWTERRATWRSGPQSKQATRLTGELISLTRTWFSVTPLQASMALVAWILLHPRVAVEIFCAARPRPGRLFDLSGSACSEVPAWELTPGWMAR